MGKEYNRRDCYQRTKRRQKDPTTQTSKETTEKETDLLVPNKEPRSEKIRSQRFMVSIHLPLVYTQGSGLKVWELTLLMTC